jgi:hypothetical protein
MSSGKSKKVILDPGGYYQFKPKPKLVEQNSLNQILSKAVLFPVPG